MLIATFQAKGEFTPTTICALLYLRIRSVLEYVTQDDADYALRKLDNRELRGIAVRVEPDVSMDHYFTVLSR